ncbi:MAG: DNA translocase FtsK, partial [Betaproteobacteria bacterium]|nr:DNA translocase FtsK [Betaproteobacteria bacterium]
MTYSLRTLTNAAGTSENDSSTGLSEGVGLMRFTQEIVLFMGAALLLVLALAMFSFSPKDPSWSGSGLGGPVVNWMGLVGAWLSDGMYFCFGYSAWWLVALLGRLWLNAWADWLRGNEPALAQAPEEDATWKTRLVFGVGLIVLMSASCALEWARLARWDAALPGTSGGALGYAVGHFSLKWLGFNGAALLEVVCVALGMGWAFGFSWGQVCENLGAKLDGLMQSRQVKREMEEDLAMGQQALREREQLQSKLPVEPQLHPFENEFEEKPLFAAAGVAAPVFAEPVAPMVIEAPVVDVPRSERVVKERQKPLFNELPDSKLPQVDLLDSLTQRQEGVAPETLEMTSRMIEKRLKDFGVEVRVVAAAPGPVITRYEIEPATGVKGSQVVNLAKDLARSLSLISIRVVETIPGKNYMALELPNAKRQSIKLSEILGSQVYNEAKSLLTMGLGKDIVGNPVVADLAKMPHVLVAGTTGSGKSVGINAMILSLLYKAEARDVRLLMIDPKMLEMS